VSRVSGLLATLLFGWASTGRASDQTCQPSFSNAPPSYTLANTLRWDLALSATELSRDWRFAGTFGLGVAKIVDVSYQSFDIGAHATLGTTVGNVTALFETAEADVRFYPIKLRQALGIDQRGCGTKTRRWSETTDGVGYILARVGYGHVGGDVPTHQAFLLTPGVGYEGNLGEGRLTSLFAQVAWRFDVFGGGTGFPIGGPFLEAGLRF